MFWLGWLEIVGRSLMREDEVLNLLLRIKNFGSDAAVLELAFAA